VIKKRGIAAAIGLVAVAVFLVPAPTADASPSCGLLGCSTTANQSRTAVLAVRDWTCSYGTTGYASPGCVSLSNTRWLSSGQWTPAGQDWDAFRVDAGWCYKVELFLPYKDWTMYYDRSGMSTPIYVKVEDHGIAFVHDQKYGSCP
jgi:hypothetical protein